MICIQGRMMGFSFGQENLKNEKKGGKTSSKMQQQIALKAIFR